MSTMEAMSEAIEKLYDLNRIINAMNQKPHLFSDELLYASEAHTLKQIAANQGISQSEISDKMYRTKGATSLIVGSLVDRGLVNREREPGNRRRYLLTLSEHGQAVNAAHLAFDEKSAALANETMQLSEEELLAFMETLDKFIGFAASAYLEHGRVIQDSQQVKK